jgi:alpha-ribazole phosphatase
MSERVIYLLRHGPPVRTGLLLGHTDEPALDVGCSLTRAKVQRLLPARIVTSDLCRASVQAEALAHHLDVPLTVDPAWRELDFGAWDGRAASAVDGQALARFWDDPDGHAPPEGESWSGLRARIASALATLETRTLVVTHAGAMRAAVSVLTGLDHRGVWAVDLPYHALLRLRLWPGTPASGAIVGLDTGEAG